MIIFRSNSSIRIVSNDLVNIESEFKTEKERLLVLFINALLPLLRNREPFLANNNAFPSNKETAERTYDHIRTTKFSQRGFIKCLYLIPVSNGTNIIILCSIQLTNGAPIRIIFSCILYLFMIK